MKNIIGLFIFVILSSFVTIQNLNKLSNGHYKVVLDKKYKNLDLNDYEFTLEDSKFIYKLGKQVEDFEIIWIDENTFKVKGLTEPANPNEFEKEILKNTQIYFRISKQEKNEYSFILSDDIDKYPVYSGKFVKKE